MKDKRLLICDGVVAGLRVVGFHGVVTPERTPALQAPVYVDDENRLSVITSENRLEGWVAVECSDHDVLVDGLPSDGTTIDGWLPARLGWGFIVLGDCERYHAVSLLERVRARDPERLREVMAALAGERGDAASASGTLPWYCSLAEATILRNRIRSVALDAIRQAAAAGDLDDLERSGWWLQRAGVERLEYLHAAAALKEAGSPDWLAVAGLLVQDRSAVDVEADVERIQRRLRGESVESESAGRGWSPDREAKEEGDVRELAVEDVDSWTGSMKAPARFSGSRAIRGPSISSTWYGPL